MNKTLLAGTLSALILGGAVAPAMAQRDWQLRRRGVGVRAADMNARQRQLLERADQIARRADNLYRSGRLSRDHRDRTIDKLDRIYDNRRRVNDSEFQADTRWLNQVETTLEQWSAAYDGGGVRSRRWRR